MIRLGTITEENWVEAIKLQLKEEQKNYVAVPVGILARAYAYRNCNAKVYTIENQGKIIGLAMVRDFEEEPIGYELQQFMIDRNYQNQGFGTEALRAILEDLKREARYSSVEVCVKMSDKAALHVYEKVGFVDTGYVDESVPDAFNLIYRWEA